MYFLSSDHLWVLFPDVFMVVTSEVAVDIIKHAFITKFNDITADVRTTLDIHVSFTNNLSFCNFSYSITPYLSLLQVYSEYRASLAFDLVSSRQKNVGNCLLSPLFL